MRKLIDIKVINKINQELEYKKCYSTGRFQSYKTIKMALKGIGEDVTQYEFHQSYCKNIVIAEKTFKYDKGGVQYKGNCKILTLSNSTHKIIISIKSEV